MNTYTEALARAYYETQQTCGIIPIEVQKNMQDRALKAFEEGCSEDGIYYRALLATAGMRKEAEAEHKEETGHTFARLYSRRTALLNKMRFDIENQRDKLNSHKRNNVKKSYYNRCIQLIETLKCLPREHPFNNNRIDRMPRFIERRYKKEFIK